VRKLSNPDSKQKVKRMMVDMITETARQSDIFRPPTTLSSLEKPDHECMPGPKSTREDGESYISTGMTKLVTRAAKRRENSLKALSMENQKIGYRKARGK
jgi:hypothetical protein